MRCDRIALIAASRRCQVRAKSTTSSPQTVPTLRDASVDTFRAHAFDLCQPALLPAGHFQDKLPAISKWFHRRTRSSDVELNTAYWSKFGSTLVPLELSHKDEFLRMEQSLSFFLDTVHAQGARTVSSFYKGFPKSVETRRNRQKSDFFESSAPAPAKPRFQIYLAQARIEDFPSAIRNDAPTPDLVLHAGKGDVYDSSIWLGPAPTYTPLHRDPNPNLFVQIAGVKKIRLFHPDIGRAVFDRVQEKIGAHGSSTIRGDEMMQGPEKRLLELEVWQAEGGALGACWEAELKCGDGLFIPKGWWHSVRSSGTGMTGSINWWFR